MSKIYKTEYIDITLSSFSCSNDELFKMAVGVCTALQLITKSNFPPVAVVNEYDDFYGRSITIEQKVTA